MKIHRFYQPKLNEDHHVWVHDHNLLQQWQKVLRFRPGQEFVLFNGQGIDRLYRVGKLDEHEAELTLITEFEPKLPSRTIYLFWSLLKKDKNDWVIQKCTELGVSHFVPVLAERSEKTGLNLERASKIAIEAAEQCGRSDIPTIREPIGLDTAIQEFKDKLPLFVCEQSDDVETPNAKDVKELGVFVGPEGGWTDTEKQFFADNKVLPLHLGDFTQRAETACVTATAKLV
jgi:16S rRNA (uracil1498-N3)-methyltransferase